jgi:hypothetical protein
MRSFMICAPHQTSGLSNQEQRVWRSM